METFEAFFSGKIRDVRRGLYDIRASLAVELDVISFIYRELEIFHDFIRIPVANITPMTAQADTAQADTCTMGIPSVVLADVLVLIFLFVDLTLEFKRHGENVL
jgi:hypothetical protein